MTLERYIRLIAGTFILTSLALGHWVSSYWYLFTAFVGANLIQSALTGWCLMEDILRALGVRSAPSGTVVASERHLHRGQGEKI